MIPDTAPAMTPERAERLRRLEPYIEAFVHARNVGDAVMRVIEEKDPACRFLALLDVEAAAVKFQKAAAS